MRIEVYIKDRLEYERVINRDQVVPAVQAIKEQIVRGAKDYQIYLIVPSKINNENEKFYEYRNDPVAAFY